jgi:hypothetical protein
VPERFSIAALLRIGSLYTREAFYALLTESESLPCWGGFWLHNRKNTRHGRRAYCVRRFSAPTKNTPSSGCCRGYLVCCFNRRVSNENLQVLMGKN